MTENFANFSVIVLNKGDVSLVIPIILIWLLKLIVLVLTTMLAF